MTRATAIWIAALAGVAIVTGFAQLDRSTRYTPSLARLVPPAFQGFAAQRLAAEAIVAKDLGDAQAFSQRLIRHRPLPAEHMLLLARTATMRGDEARAFNALDAASLRGWRDPLTQLMAGEAALAGANHEAAAQRLAAMLATGALPEMARSLAGRLIATPEGRGAMARQLAGEGRWQENALTPLAAEADPMDFAQTIAQAHTLGAQWSCQRLEPLAATLPPAAAALVVQDCR